MPRSFSGSGVSPSSLSLDDRLNPNVAHAAQTVVVAAASVYYFGLTLWRRATVATEAARVRVSSTREVREIPGDCQSRRAIQHIVLIGCMPIRHGRSPVAGRGDGRGARSRERGRDPEQRLRRCTASPPEMRANDVSPIRLCATPRRGKVTRLDRSGLPYRLGA
jgi:hypothetical protein